MTGPNGSGKSAFSAFEIHLYGRIRGYGKCMTSFSNKPLGKIICTGKYKIKRR
jgi:hypothetical protein